MPPNPVRTVFSSSAAGFVQESTGWPLVFLVIEIFCGAFGATVSAPGVVSTKPRRNGLNVIFFVADVSAIILSIRCSSVVPHQLRLKSNGLPVLMKTPESGQYNELL